MTWIRLKDRKPEEGQRCLVAVPESSSINAYVSASVWLGKGFNNMLLFPGSPQPTYWMPSPELPEDLAPFHGEHKPLLMARVARPVVVRLEKTRTSS